jgi:uncharacterized protein (DUF952 family)
VSAPVVPSPDDIVHVTTPAAWAEARRTGFVRPPSLESEGFAHCSIRSQLPDTLARHFPGADPLVGLVLDAAAVAPWLRWEESRPGERFPHVYAPIPVGAVLSVEPLR